MSPLSCLTVQQAEVLCPDRLCFVPCTGLPPPTKRPVPRVITFQRKRANRRVVNEEQLVALLQKFGQARSPSVGDTALSVSLRGITSLGSDNCERRRQTAVLLCMFYLMSLRLLCS